MYIPLQNVGLAAVNQAVNGHSRNRVGCRVIFEHDLRQLDWSLAADDLTLFLRIEHAEVTRTLEGFCCGIIGHRASLVCALHAVGDDVLVRADTARNRVARPDRHAGAGCIRVCERNRSI